MTNELNFIIKVFIHHCINYGTCINDCVIVLTGSRSTIVSFISMNDLTCRTSGFGLNKGMAVKISNTK